MYTISHSQITSPQPIFSSLLLLSSPHPVFPSSLAPAHPLHPCKHLCTQCVPVEFLPPPHYLLTTPPSPHPLPSHPSPTNPIQSLVPLHMSVPLSCCIFPVFFFFFLSLTASNTCAYPPELQQACSLPSFLTLTSHLAQSHYTQYYSSFSCRGLLCELFGDFTSAGTIHKTLCKVAGIKKSIQLEKPIQNCQWSLVQFSHREAPVKLSNTF